MSPGPPKSATTGTAPLAKASSVVRPNARFILSATDREPTTVETLRKAAARMQGQATVETNLPYAEVKAAWEKAAVAMVLTKTPEPFGRTALEALASGAALLTSGLGGLAEVCGPHAEVANPADREGLVVRLATLLDYPEIRAKRARGPRPGRTALRHKSGREADGRFRRRGAWTAGGQGPLISTPMRPPIADSRPEKRR